MAETFVLQGDPSAIRSSAARWRGFADTSSSAAADVRGLQTGEFVGDEADEYRGRINKDLAPHLSTTGDAWGIVAAALDAYATRLEDLQAQMSRLASAASAQSQQVSAARSTLASAQSADAAHTRQVAAEQQQLAPGQSMPPDSYVSHVSSSQSGLSAAQSALQGTTDAAASVRSENAAAVRQCCAEIDRASGMRFVKPPGFWGRLGAAVSGWIKEHADVLQAISSVLKTISAVAGVLALIPGLDVVMGPVALIAGGAALGIDLTVKLATGKGSWTDIAMDAVGVIPGVGALRGARLAEDAVSGERALASGERLAADAGGAERAAGRAADPEDMIKVKLQDLTDRANAKFDSGELSLTFRQQRRVDLNRLLGRKNDMYNTFKGDRIDKYVKKEVAQAQGRGDPDLVRVEITPRGKQGPDFKNVRGKPHEGQWYDITTKDSWNAHVARYHPDRPTPAQPDYGERGVGIFWR